MKQARSKHKSTSIQRCDKNTLFRNLHYVQCSVLVSVVTVYNNSCSHCNTCTTYCIFFRLRFLKENPEDLRWLPLLIHSIEVFFSVLTFSSCSSSLFIISVVCFEWLQRIHMNLSRERHRVSLFSSFRLYYQFIVLLQVCWKYHWRYCRSYSRHWFWFHCIQNSKIRAFIFIKRLYTWVYGHLGCCLFLVRLFSIFLFRSLCLKLVKWLSQELHTNAYLKVLNYMRYAT